MSSRATVPPAIDALIARAKAVAGTRITLLTDGGPGGVAPAECLFCTRFAADAGLRNTCGAAWQRAVKAAHEHGRALPFVCDLGLSYLAFPLAIEATTVAVLGPYVPRGTDTGLAAAMAPRLHAAESEWVDALAALPRPAPGTMAALAAWLQADIAAALVAESPATRDSEDEPALRSARRGRTRPAPAQAESLAVALAEGDLARVRAGVRNALSVAPALAVARADALALLGETLAAAAGAGMDLAPAWARMPETTAELAAAHEVTGLAEALVRGLRPLVRARVPVPLRPAEGPLVRLIQARLPEPVLLEEIAAAIGERPSTISQRLRRKYGLSFSDLAGRLRVEEAQRLLRETRLELGEIARRVGVPDRSNFNRLFRKHTGVLPSAYRARSKRSSTK